MLIRAIALSIALVIGVGVIIPLATETTEAGPHHSKYKRHHKYRKYSKAWWRQYHKRQRARRALAVRRRALRLEQLRMAEARKTEKSGTTDKKDIVKTSAAVEPPSLLPSGEEAPRGWKKTSATPGELKFGLTDSSGQTVGNASITVVGPAMGDNNARNTLAGVPTTSLRREVINRMVSENGWVVNDYRKDVNGKTVYVVVAQSQNGGRLSSRMFYFTEVDGRIYSVTTTSSPDATDRLSDETEKVINSLQNGARRKVQRAALQE
ncbi:MAG TPA: hypothetical protein VLI65_04940 [Pyrinomonadaceae bacterium]|nr:hypothetical protein [Pyrinomonadaceae bacterium]